MAIPNLWPDDIADSNMVTPLTILKEQAAGLGSKTHNIVTAEVKSAQTNQNFVHTLILDAPAISYRYQLCYLQHTITLYPVTGVFEGAVTTLKSEEELVGWLRNVFNSGSTKNIIKALIAQSSAPNG